MAGGSLDRLLWRGLLPGQHALDEQEVGASLDPRPNETVLLFQLDEPYNELRRDQPDGTRICDGLFLYRRKPKANTPPWLLFFELKRGESFEHAVTQLISAVTLVAAGLHPRCDERRIHAVVVSGTEAPPDRQFLLKSFRKSLKEKRIRASLGFVVCPKKQIVDLRDELTTRIHETANA